MERIFLNQTALSLGYIALKRIRALEESTTRLPSSPLLRHLSHIKILAACVEQVGPEEIIEYEINQDIAVGEPLEDALEPAYIDAEVGSGRLIPERKNMYDDVANPQYQEYMGKNNATTKPLCIIAENDEEIGFEPPVHDFERRKFFITNLSHEDIEAEDGEYSMDELYDEYNSQDDNWETASESSDDDQSHIENVSPTTSKQQPVPRQTIREIESDSEEEENKATPPNIVISHSPPLDITLRHPITHELNKREQYRRQTNSTSSDISCAFVEQFEDVLFHEIRSLSTYGLPGRMRLETATQQTISLYA